MQTLSQSQLEAAMAAANDADASPEERAEMLMEMAMGMQQRPKSAQQLHDAVRSAATHSGPTPLEAHPSLLFARAHGAAQGGRTQEALALYLAAAREPRLAAAALQRPDQLPHTAGRVVFALFVVRHHEVVDSTSTGNSDHSGRRRRKPTSSCLELRT